MLYITGENLELVFHKKSGKWMQYSVNERAFFANPPQPNFWRPPTDNDLGNGMHQWAAIWRRAGREAIGKLLNLQKSSDKVSLDVSYSFPFMEGEVLILHYTIYPDGEVKVEYNFHPPAQDLPKIPRIGLAFQLNKAYEYMQWYGRGPHETYMDRKTSGEIAVWKGRVWEQLHRYSRPQETGNKTDVRWMSLCDTSGVGLKVEADMSPLSMSAWQLGSQELDFVAGAKGSGSASGLVPLTSKHGAELSPADFITWNIDWKQMGVGGDNSWGAPVHEEYTLPVKEYFYSFRFVPIGK